MRSPPPVAILCDICGPACILQVFPVVIINIIKIFVCWQRLWRYMINPVSMIYESRGRCGPDDIPEIGN